MIRKIILFGDFKIGESKALKTASVMRLTYSLRTKGYDVKQVHHCTNFTSDELKQILTDFSAGEKVCVCVSTSFMAGVDRQNTTVDKLTKDKIGGGWGTKSFLFLLNIGRLCQEFNFPYLLGGWEISEQQIKEDRSWSYNILSKYVTYFVEGKDTDIIEDVCNDNPIQYKIVDETKKIAFSKGELDFSDCASTLTYNDVIKVGESVCTEVAAGCIFSCSFCTYAALGKKKNEYTRSYESFEKEIIQNYENFKIDFYTLTDNIVNDTPEKIRYLIDVRNKTGIDLKWTGYVRLDSIQSKEQAKLLKESGMVGANFGIESMYKKSGSYIGKMTDKVRVIKSLEIMRNVFEDDAILTGLFITGLPEEPIDHMIETFEWLNSIEGRHLLDSYAYTALIIFPNNDLKNDINKSRNNPFRDYVVLKPKKWTSPWGSYKQMLELAREFTVNKSNHVSSFSLPYFVNVGYDLQEFIKSIRESGRKGERFVCDFSQQTNKFIEDYKKKVLNKP